MADFYFQEVVIGAGLLVQARFVGESLGDAVLRIECDGGLPEGGFVLSKPESDTAQILNNSTGVWAPGLYRCRLWFDWQTGDLENEVALEIRLSVVEAL